MGYSPPGQGDGRVRLRGVTSTRSAAAREIAAAGTTVVIDALGLVVKGMMWPSGRVPALSPNNRRLTTMS